MEIAGFLHEYGYLAIALGSFLEGEAVLLAGSFAASQGHLELKAVLLIATLGSFLGDLPYFFAGRRYGESVVARFPSAGYRRARLDRLLQRHHSLAVLSLRFLYGLRIPGLLALGMSRLPTFRFLCLDFIGAMIWAAVVCVAGYGTGSLIERLFGGGLAIERIFVLAVILVSSFMLVVRTRRRMLARSACANDETRIEGM